MLTKPVKPWIDPGLRIAELEQQIATLQQQLAHVEEQLAAARVTIGAAWEALPDSIDETRTLADAIGEVQRFVHHVVRGR